MLFRSGRVRELPEVHGLYRNDGNGHFTAIQFQPGVYQDEKGNPIRPYRDWGLAAMFRDINGDGVPDLYVCNDNTSPDRIWINNGNGTFRAIEPLSFRHTSRSSMGVDFGDLDRDGRDDVFVVDMLARMHGKRMTQLVRDRPSMADIERPESRPQFNRNTMFFGRADGTFVESALMAGLAATDWTWSPLLLDVDLDGYEDVLVTNGFEFDVMDQDSHNEIKDGRRRMSDAQLKRSMQLHPRWRTRNAAFHNMTAGVFRAAGAEWGFDHEGVSYGMAAADLDGDGDLDLVVSNLNEEATLYRNNSGADRVGVRLKGMGLNSQGIGARIRLTGGGVAQSQEMICGGRYLSGDEALRVFAFRPDRDRNLRLEVQWRTGRKSFVTGVEANRVYEVYESGSVGAGAGAAPTTVPASTVFTELEPRISHGHVDGEFDDWARQPTLPRRLSHLGPGVAWLDFDGDGWEDLVITSGRGGACSIYHNDGGRGFSRMGGPPEATMDEGSVIGWMDGLGNRRVLIATSNLEVAPGRDSDRKSTRLNSSH